MNNKTIARHELSFLGGNPMVDVYYNTDESKQIDIVTVSDGALKGVSVCTTIGLYSVDIGLTAKGKELRVELIAAGDVDSEQLGCMLSTMAFDIMDSGICVYGMVVPNAVGLYFKDTEMQHAVLLSPPFWPSYEVLEEKDRMVSWLIAVPISDAERVFIQENGIDVFDELLETKEADVLDFHRKSLV